MYAVLTVKETREGQGYVMYRLKKPGYSPDPKGSFPLLGKPAILVVEEVLEHLRKTEGLPSGAYEIID